MTRAKVLGGLWILLGISGFTLTAYNMATLAVDPEYGLSSTFYEPSWWLTQAFFPVFFVAAAVAGSGVFLQRRWALWAFRVLAPIMLLYTLAYTVFGGERAWWWTLVGLSSLVLAVFSVSYAYANRPAAT